MMTVRGGDLVRQDAASAFGEWIASDVPMLLRLATRVASRSAAEEIVQETLLRA